MRNSSKTGWMLKDSNQAFLEYVDGSPLIVDRPTQLIQRDGNLYSVQLPADFPVSLSGNWATDEPLLVNQVDRALRAELVNETDLALGAAVVGRSAVVVESLADLVGSPRKTTHTYHVREHRPGITTGGGVFVWDPLMPRSMHNGGTVISPTVPAYTAQPGLADYLAGVGETEPSASGAFVRRIENNAVRLEYFGWVEGELGTAPLAMLLRETRSNEGDGANIGAVAVLPPGTIRTAPFVIGSNQIIGATSRTVVLQEPGTVIGDNAPFIAIASQTNVYIRGNGMQINGQKNEATSGEGRYGLFLYGSKNVLVQDLSINAFSGDGAALTGNVGLPCEDINLERVLCNYNGRNGVSIVNAKRATLTKCRSTNTNTNGMGASANGPWAGFDIEPNEGSGYYFEDINMYGCSAQGNAGFGLQFTIPNTDSAISVRVYGFQSYRNGSATQYGAKGGGIGFVYGGGKTPSLNMYGEIVIHNPHIEQPFGSAIRFGNWSAKNAAVIVNNASARNLNFAGATGNINRCGVWLDSTDSLEVVESKGNFDINGFTVFNDNLQMVRPVWCLGATNAPVIANIRNVRVNRHGYPSVERMRVKVVGGITWDTPPVVTLSTAPGTDAFEYAGQHIEAAVAGAFPLPEAALTIGTTYMIRNASSGNVAVTPAAGAITASTYGTYTNNGTTLTLTPRQYAELKSNGSSWLLK